MFSLVLAALAVAFQMLSNNTEPVVAVENVLPFLWGWHMVFAVIKFCFWLLFPVIGALFGAAGDTRGQRGAGLAIVLGSPLILALMMISSVLFLGGVYAVDSGLQAGEVANQSHVVIGGILYGLAALMQLTSKSSSRSSDKD